MKRARLGRILSAPLRRLGAGPCVFSWRPGTGTNFGDELSLAVVQGMLRQLGQPATVRRCNQEQSNGRRLFAVGSALHFCHAGDLVWGSGINGKINPRNYNFSGIDFRAVRGPLSAELVRRSGGQCPDLHGDPALLLPELYPELGAGPAPSPTRAQDRVKLVIPNLNDAVLDTLPAGSQFTRIDPSRPWQEVAKQIAGAGFVAASSLHGIILADAFGTPCRPLLSRFEAPFKFEDYLLATGRDRIEYARDLDAALALGPIPPSNLDTSALRNAFPMDFFAGRP